jgi:hypothetical protein
MDEVEKYHLDTLRLAIEATNRDRQALAEREDCEREVEMAVFPNTKGRPTRSRSGSSSITDASDPLQAAAQPGWSHTGRSSGLLYGIVR